MNLQRPEPELDELGNPIHKTDGEVAAFFRKGLSENSVLLDVIFESYWNLRALGVDINEARDRAIDDVSIWLTSLERDE